MTAPACPAQTGDQAGDHAGDQAGDHAGERVVWVMSLEAAEELGLLLGIVEDFLHQASEEAVTELAEYPPARPTDPSVWADWVADRLGEAAVTLHALATRSRPTTTATTTQATTQATTRTGEPR
jgi:hypothetical protein